MCLISENDIGSLSLSFSPSCQNGLVCKGSNHDESPRFRSHRHHHLRYAFAFISCYPLLLMEESSSSTYYAMLDCVEHEFYSLVKDNNNGGTTAATTIRNSNYGDFSMDLGAIMGLCVLILLFLLVMCQSLASGLRKQKSKVHPLGDDDNDGNGDDNNYDGSVHNRRDNNNIVMDINPE